MKRFSKRLGFGLLYLAILGAIGFGIYYFFFRPEPSCFDNKKNGEEVGVDCGGPCIPCGLVGVALEQAAVQIIPAAGGQTTLIVQVKNPSPDYAAFFSYDFKVISKIGGELVKYRGQSFIGTSQSKYLVAPRLEVRPDDIGRVDFIISNPSWNLSPIIPSYRLEPQEVKTLIEVDRFKVTGKMVNNSASASPELRLITLILDKEGEIIAASSSLASSVGAFSEKQFTVFLPLPLRGETLLLSELETKIFWEEAL